jgi:hypothetical protein
LSWSASLLVFNGSARMALSSYVRVLACTDCLAATWQGSCPWNPSKIYQYSPLAQDPQIVAYAILVVASVFGVVSSSLANSLTSLSFRQAFLDRTFLRCWSRWPIAVAIDLGKLRQMLFDVSKGTDLKNLDRSPWSKLRW